MAVSQFLRRGSGEQAHLSRSSGSGAPGVGSVMVYGLSTTSMYTAAFAAKTSPVRAQRDSVQIERGNCACSEHRKRRCLCHHPAENHQLQLRLRCAPAPQLGFAPRPVRPL